MSLLVSAVSIVTVYFHGLIAVNIIILTVAVFTVLNIKLGLGGIPAQLQLLGLLQPLQSLPLLEPLPPLVLLLLLLFVLLHLLQSGPDPAGQLLLLGLIELGHTVQLQLGSSGDHRDIHQTGQNWGVIGRGGG